MELHNVQITHCSEHVQYVELKKDYILLAFLSLTIQLLIQLCLIIWK